jgi:shikimate kinase
MKFNGQNQLFHGISVFMSNEIDSLQKSILDRLNRPVVIVGMMGAGKTKIGRMLSRSLDIDFVDVDDEIVKAAGCSIPDIFEYYGEKAFRDGERRVIKRLLGQDGVRVISTGGGSMLNKETAKEIYDRTVSIWVKADVDVIVERTARNDRRPLLQTGNPEEIITKLLDERSPIYQKANIIIESHNGPVQAVLNQTMEKLDKYLLAREDV